MKNLSIIGIRLSTLCLFFGLCFLAKAEDGHSLWLRMVEAKQPASVRIDGAMPSTTLDIAADELEKYWRQKENIVLKLMDVAVANDGYLITKDGSTVAIVAPTELGLLYGAYELLRQQATITTKLKKGITFISSPYFKYRVLNHWDNLNGTIERGFAGRSIFSKNGITSFDPKIIEEYARANASIGINGTVVNNVNASPQILTDQNLFRLTDVANILRPYGIRLYISVNFASPMVLEDSIKTADPLDPAVKKWWAEKVDHIYKLIPDFGGFLVKANSEGQPGPMDYGRTHVDGANMLAEVLEPFGGIVMWRAFVYAADSPDRANQAYQEFMPYDGKFKDNVIIQIKNGPIDFQPREPVSPLFYSMRKTNIMPEFQITQEYTGESIHTCFLATLWKEFFVQVTKADNGLFRSNENNAIAGVANIGDSQNWCGSDMAQANWYAFGRLAWNPNLSDTEIANEWLSQTFSRSPKFLSAMTNLLCSTHEAVVSYMMPMGLHHIFAGDHHYGPAPWYAPRGVRSDWTPPYYHKADEKGLGFDRTTSGSANVKQYPSPLSEDYNDIHKCPENLILYFHHVNWNFKMKNGKTMWENLCMVYDQGVVQAEGFVETWKSMKEYVDNERYEKQLVKFERQAKDAWWWRDACLLYFQTFSKLPLPENSPAPRHNLDDLMKYRLRMDNYTAADITKLP